MTTIARALFAAVLGPLILAAILRRPLMPRNFHGCAYVLGRYPMNLPLLHRVIYSWWIIPMNIYREAVQDARMKRICCDGL